MDPQHRLFLEVAGRRSKTRAMIPSGYPGKVGVLSSRRWRRQHVICWRNCIHANLPGQTASTSHINNDKDFLSTRVSFKFNLRGPSFTIQSACSSSLLAVHQACQNLSFNECDMMLVGGSVVRVPQVDGYLAEKRNLYSLDGHCRPFDEAGQGTIFGSGVGAVLLKPLEQGHRRSGPHLCGDQRDCGKQRWFGKNQLHRAKRGPAVPGGGRCAWIRPGSAQTASAMLNATQPARPSVIRWKSRR